MENVMYAGIKFPINQLIRFYEEGGMIFIDGNYTKASDLKKTAEVYGLDYCFLLVGTPGGRSKHLTWS